jgi:NAD(P)-dependent dehydrogenase (short-subunit alcohol dehydrogenase family)
MGRFDDTTAIVTGAGSGIGRATALRLASEGAAVACLDVSGAEEETAASAVALGSKAVAVRCDVSDQESVREAVARAVSALGPPRVVCNVAGVGRFTHTPEVALAEWERIVGVNLTGPFLVCRETLPYLLENQGNIVNVASTAGIMGQPYSAAYCASKGGVIMLTKALAVEYLERNVRVNAVAPGGVETPILASFVPPEDSSMKLVERIVSPMGMAKPEEIAALIAFVASDEARYMTGAVVTMDGGLTA